MTISSHHNQKLKQIRKLRQRRRWRERAGRFVAEGEDVIAAADAAGWEPVERYAAAGSGLPGVEVESELLASAWRLASGTRALAVYEERWAPAPAGPLCVYLHGLADPGNVGTILRSAQAFGASSVALGPATADPFGPKAVRASMGAVFAVPLAKADRLADLPGSTVALVAGQGVPLAEVRHETLEKRPDRAALHDQVDITLLVGAEREGLPRELVEQADLIAHIPSQIESLNAAMAATVALYELTRMAAE